MKRSFPRLLAAGAFAAAGTLAFAAQAASPAHDSAHRAHDDHAPAAHAHEPAADAHTHEHGHGVPELKLDHGRKWASDEALRTSMSRIGTAVDETLPAVHAGKMSAAQYDALGREIDAQVANIVQNCKLEPAADEVLHAILATMLGGNETLQGRNPNAKRGAGVVQVVEALEQYGAHFEHPGFAAPQAEH